MFELALPHPVSRIANRVRRLWPHKGDDRFSAVLEHAARLGYGARGFVYLSIGALALLSVLDSGGRIVGTRGVAVWLAEQPFGRVWLVALGLGLWAFVGWRVLQSVFDADREGRTPLAIASRAGEAISGLFYAILASGVFELLDEVGLRAAADDAAENREKAAFLLGLPFGDVLLMTVAALIAGVGLGNIINGLRSDFTDRLSCSPRWCRRLSLMARAGYVARGLAYLPLACLTALAGWRARTDEVTDMAGSLRALQDQPGGSAILIMTAAGLLAFGGFAFVEARFRRIRAPKALKTLG